MVSLRVWLVAMKTFSAGTTALARSTASARRDCPLLVRVRSCFGRDARDIGQKRSPVPPAMITITLMT